MKNVIYKKRELAQRGRVISIRERFEDEECATQVRKNYIYLLSRADEVPQKPEAPQISVTKRIDSAKKNETFVFKIKGVIHITEKRFIYRVEYCHSLLIHMTWKTHVLSSKPAALA
ncbi:MAG: hypothetical protein HQL16_07500 [Candidatus Omnitrophica bacterium]|nr:hypothetical protein [Candidatus Omnitrophota bacterium]